jgi:hypothetical protein
MESGLTLVFCKTKSFSSHQLGTVKKFDIFQLRIYCNKALYKGGWGISGGGGGGGAPPEKPGSRVSLANRFANWVILSVTKLSDSKLISKIRFYKVNLEKFWRKYSDGVNAQIFSFSPNPDVKVHPYPHCYPARGVFLMVRAEFLSLGDFVRHHSTAVQLLSVPAHHKLNVPGA